MNDERTTKEIINVLGDDCDRCRAELLASIDNGEIYEDGNLDTDYEFHARQLIRAIFAYIQSLTFSKKASSP